MQIFRIAQEVFASDLSGKGAWLNGGRWNSEGRFALYASESRALALLETLAHTPAKMLTIKTYHLMTLELPNTITPEQISPGILAAGWNAPDMYTETVMMGDLFLKRKKSLLLKVPSVMMPEEWNYLLNPLHPEMEYVKIVQRRKINFDKRAL